MGEGRGVVRVESIQGIHLLSYVCKCTRLLSVCQPVNKKIFIGRFPATGNHLPQLPATSGLVNTLYTRSQSNLQRISIVKCPQTIDKMLQVRRSGTKKGLLVHTKTSLLKRAEGTSSTLNLENDTALSKEHTQQNKEKFKSTLIVHGFHVLRFLFLLPPCS